MGTVSPTPSVESVPTRDSTRPSSRPGAVERSRDLSRISPDVSSSRTITTRPSAGGEGIDRIRDATRDRISERRTDSVRVRTDGNIDRSERVRTAGPELRTQTALEPRLQRSIGSRPARVVQRDLGGIHREYTVRPRIVYRDRPDLVRHAPRHVHVYRDPYDRLCHRIIWPRYYYPIYYTWGPYRTFHWVYPYYHRKYVFVSLGGWWPWDYDYVRYYWYGYHPYSWMGYYPIAREVQGDTYNYYTYNYYTADGVDSTAPAQTSSGGLPYGIDAETYARVQQRIREQQVTEPAAATVVDSRFEAGVTSFEAGNYAEAAQAFASAMEMAPSDVILPFAYSQALFAGGRYSEAAEALRAALSHASPEKEGVFYPRGLYAEDDALFAQIEKLLDKVDAYGFDADLQLLLGYHLLGVGETPYARGALEQASKDIRNAQAATVLLSVLEKQEAAGTDSPDVGSTADASTPVAEPAPGASKAGVLDRMKARDDDANTHTGQMIAPDANLPQSPANKEDNNVPQAM